MTTNRAGSLPLIVGLALLVGCTASVTPSESSRASAAVSHAVGAQPRAVAVADLDGDGVADVVVANAGDGTLAILRGLGEGRLASARPVGAGREPGDVDAIDVDGDGRVDLVVANHETSSISVLRNEGELQFSMHVIDTGARPHLHGLACADFDGDGAVEIAVESSDGREICIVSNALAEVPRVTRVGVDTMPYYRLGFADVTGDARPEVLVPGHDDLSVRFVGAREGSMALLESRIGVSAKPWMVIGDDVDGDGRDDVIVVLTDAVAVWLTRNAGFEPARGSPFAVPGATEVASGDIDGDGLADIVVGPWDGSSVTVIRGGLFTTQSFAACPRPVGLAIADLDGDGRGEVLAVSATENRLVVVANPTFR